MSSSENSESLSSDERAESDLHGLNAAELLARGLHTVKPSANAGGWIPPEPEALGRMLPQYRIESLLGRGGMGAVYKAVQLSLDRVVAIKLLPTEVAADAQFVARFEREARTLAKLQNSRIVTIYEFGRTEAGHLFFVMEYVDGTNLREIIRGPGLDPEQALAVVGQLCDALQVAHREGIVHRDIKPENVLITREGYVKLADFGLARPPQEQDSTALTMTNVIMGTPDYMAPEQRVGAAKADHRSDIFALGVMFYEMLTGHTPHGVFEMPSRKLQVDVRIDEVVLKALQAEPDRRYQKASEMKTDVENIRTTPPATTSDAKSTPGRKKASPADRRRARSRHWMVITGVAALVLAAGSFIVFRAAARRDAAPMVRREAPQQSAVEARPGSPGAATPVASTARIASTAPAPTPGSVAISTPIPVAPSPVPAKPVASSAVAEPPVIPSAQSIPAVATATPAPSAEDLARAEFLKVLTSNVWSWNGGGAQNSREAEAVFRPDGSIVWAGAGGTWKLTGPRAVAAIFQGATIALTFDASGRRFTGLLAGARPVVFNGALKRPVGAPKPAVVTVPATAPPPSTPAPTPTPPENPGTVLYATDFEPPTYRVGKFHRGNGLEVGDGHWSLFAAANGSDIDRAVMVKNMAFGRGMQVLEFLAEPAAKVPTGVSTRVVNNASVVLLQSDLFLQSSSKQTSWQWGVGDDKGSGQSGGFVCGFGVSGNDGKVTLMSGSQVTGLTHFPRNVWTHVEMRLDIQAQVFDLTFDGKAVVSRARILGRAKRAQIFQFNTWADGNDRAYLDNFAYIQVKP